MLNESLEQSMNANPKDVLKARLAAEDISIIDYRQLLAAISDQVTDEGKIHSSSSADRLHTGALIPVGDMCAEAREPIEAVDYLSKRQKGNGDDDVDQ